MTLDELYMTIYETDDKEELRDILDNFFHDNIVIPKGTNRHPYADVLHQWLEGADIQVKLNNKWSDYKCSLDYIKAYEYRIKPQEPVYEWQWMYKFKNGNEFLFTTYQTEEENAHFMSTIDKNSLGESSKKIEETKRVRQ